LEPGGGSGGGGGGATLSLRAASAPVKFRASNSAIYSNGKRFRGGVLKFEHCRDSIKTMPARAGNNDGIGVERKFIFFTQYNARRTKHSVPCDTKMSFSTGVLFLVFILIWQGEGNSNLR